MQMGLVGWVLAGILIFLPAIIASTKGRDMWAWAVYSVLLWPIALIHAIVARDTTMDGLKVCPECAEIVKEAARTCPHCGFNIAQLDAEQRAVEEAAVARKKAAQLKKKVAKKIAALPYEETDQTHDMMDIALREARKQDPEFSPSMSLSNLIQHYLSGHPEAPLVPDASNASLEEIKAANYAVNMWWFAVKHYCEYLQNEIEVERPAQELGDESAQERLSAAGIANNALLALYNQVSAAFNAAFDAYKAANPNSFPD
mgnify:CR=1 FL=1